jgi:hypothetical protein
MHLRHSNLSPLPVLPARAGEGTCLVVRIHSPGIICGVDIKQIPIRLLVKI